MGVKTHRLTLLTVLKLIPYGLFSPHAALPSFWGPVQSSFINVLNNYHHCGKGIEIFSVQFTVSTKRCATECLLSVITATLQLTTTFDFRFARVDLAVHSSVVLWCWQNAKGCGLCISHQSTSGQGHTLESVAAMIKTLQTLFLPS